MLLASRPTLLQPNKPVWRWIRTTLCRSVRFSAVLPAYDSHILFICTVDCAVAFLRPSVHVGEPVDVQISLVAGATSLRGVAFDRLEIQLAGSLSPISMKHQVDADDAAYLPLGELDKQEDRRTRLTWADGQEKVFAGHLFLSQEQDVSVSTRAAPVDRYYCAHAVTDRSKRSYSLASYLDGPLLSPCVPDSHRRIRSTGITGTANALSCPQSTQQSAGTWDADLLPRDAN